MEIRKIDVPVMADIFAKGEKPEYLFWVGCAGAFDDRYRKVVRAFTKVLTYLNVSYGVLGKEETCTGDPARRTGNEMLYQMQALQLIEIFKTYEIKKIITICPHCFNIFKNEYPDLGGNYEVVNYLQFLDQQFVDIAAGQALRPHLVDGHSQPYRAHSSQERHAFDQEGLHS